ncbi:MAG: hypothetical protein ACREOI_17725 [bacterium]
MIRKMILLIPAIILIASARLATAQDELVENLKFFKPYIGKTWRGELKGAGQEKPAIDISRWERALNGQAVRIVHSVNNGEYGGESIILWDNQKKSLVYYYFTTAGFYTHGTMTLENNKYIYHEYVTGYQNASITEAKGTGEFTADGKLINKSQYLKNGKWEDGHAAVYIEDTTAQVVFK